LDEVFSIADRVTVLKDGRAVATRAVSELDESSLITMILGRDLVDLYPEAAASASEATALEIEGLSGRVARDVSLTLAQGEIVGVTGLVGAGHDEVPYLVYGAERMRSGAIRVDGRELRDPTPARSKKAGLALLPADRQHKSGILRATLRENVTLPSLREYRGAAGLNHKRERTAVEAVLDRFQVVPPDPERRLATLSGGNQQKALLAKWMQINPRVLLLHEPTQGVDVGARKAIFELLRANADSGTAVLYSSVEYEDLAHICDRVMVFRRGRVAAELRGLALTPDSIARHCYQTTAA
jgi:ribose transport system ATP-binding protein